jgi:biopolymer transport protein ExbD
MGLKSRNKVSAEFSMSSLTDIIFLLLIFFMLTSALVKIDDFDLPESDSRTVADTSLLVSIRKDGRHSVNGKELPVSQLRSEIERTMGETGGKSGPTITIVAETGTSFDYVVGVMDIAARLKLRAIIATKPRT